MIIALTLLVFAGQVSAQSVSLTHILDEGRTQGIVFGQGTDIVVDVSATGFTQSVNAVTFAFDFDASLLTLNAPAGALKTADNKVTQLSITATPVPATTRFTFTTKVNVTGQEFSIGLTEVTLDTTPFSVSEMIAFNSVLPPLHLDTQIESPASNNNVLELPGKSPGDMIQFQVFVPDAAGHQFNAFQLELSLSGKTVSDYLSVLSQQGMAIQVTGNNLSLSLLSISAVTVPSNGYLDQVELSVTRALGSSDTLIVQQASLDGQQQLNVSSAALTFRTVCPGDFDDNGMINVADFLLFVAVFGTSSGDATYNAVMDMDGNGAIGIPDFLLFVDVFGTTCETTSLPPPPPPPPPSNPDRDALVALYNATDGPNWSSSMNWLSDKPIGEWYGVTTNANGLVGLWLDENQLTGEIPGELGNLSNLQVLWLDFNQLTGEIPGELGNLSNLKELNLNDNQLTGEIPEELGNLSNLKELNLNDNQLTGEIPEELGNLSNLKELNLNDNQLTGEIPEELGNLSNLEYLRLSDNLGLSGSLPGSFTSLTSLRTLALSGTGLCAPTDAVFQMWLEGIATKLGVVNCVTDYDRDDDALIEVSNLAQLDAIRYDLDGDGSPTSAAPYQSAFPNAADGMGCPSSGCIGYELTANLDFDTNGNGNADAGDAYWNDGAGWGPIGFSENEFSATFNGNDHTISNLYINSPYARGLFGYTDTRSNIKRIGVVGANVSDNSGEEFKDSTAGGLVGTNAGTISDSYVTGSGSQVTGGSAIGGLVGHNTGPIIRSYATAAVAGKNLVGGLVGQNGSSITDCYATGNVTGIGSDGKHIGGLTGGWQGDAGLGSITRSYASGDVKGNSHVGGLVGSMRNPITASYATGNVTGNTRVGGLVGGTTTLTSTITASYSIGNVAGNSEIGGLVGYNFTNGLQVTASYWDTQTSGQSTSAASGVGKTTSELQSPTGYTGIYADWNLDLDGDGTLDDPWNFGTSSQYPTLKNPGTP